ncbi:DUF58 domain-containing protein [Candidatus Pelagibacter sp.]|nr:DUF58 domain-containing protein [Candidatus Pelagibacter sp.]
MSVQSLKRFNQINFKNFFKLSNNSKIYIYPNFNGIGLSLFVFFCFLISVFYENNSGLLLSIIIFFIFFISILISHQNINNLKINSLNEYYVEANKNKKITLVIENLSKEKKLNIDINFQKQKIGNYNFFKKINYFNLNYNKKLRGIYLLNTITLNSIYPFGVIKTKINHNPDCDIIVYPQSIKPNQELLNEFNIDKSIDADDFDGIDEFKYGDSYSKIAWKKSTIDKKYIKIFKDKEKTRKLILDLDKYKELAFELLLSYSVYIIQYFHQNKANLIIKHQGATFLLDENEKSLKQIYKYLANAKN